MATFVPKFLRQLLDVALGTVADADLLVYDQATGKFTNRTAALLGLATAAGLFYVHQRPGVTGRGTAASPYVWDGSVAEDQVNVLVGSASAAAPAYWTLAGDVHMTADHTALVAVGNVKVTYAGTGHAIRIHSSQPGDPDNPTDALATDTYHQRLENIWIHVDGPAAGPAVAGNAVDVQQCHNALLRNVRVSGRWANGIYVGNTTNCTLDRPIVAGSDPRQYDYNLADSPDNGIRFGKRSGDGFGAQNTVIVAPWVRFCKLDGAYFEASSGAFGVTVHGGQIGDNGRHNLHTADATNEGITVIGTDLESSVTPIAGALDSDGAIVTVNLDGMSHRLTNVHTFGSIYLNTCRWCHIDGGRAQMVWLQNSNACTVVDTYLIGGHGRYFDVGNATSYYVRARIDFNGQFDAAVGQGEFDAMPKQLVVYDESVSPQLNAAVAANDAFWRFTRAGTTNEAHVGIIGTGGHRAGFTAGDAFVVPKDNGKGVAGGYNQAANGPGYRMFQGTFTVDRDLATLRNVSAGGTVASTGDLVAGNGHVASGQLDLQFYAGAGTNSTAVLRVFPFGAFADGVQSGFFQEPYNSRMVLTGNSGSVMDRFAVSGNYVHLSDWAYNAIPAPAADDLVVVENRNTATRVPLTVRGSALGQTGVLQRWRSGAGAVVASVDNAGVFTGSGAGLSALNAGNLASGTVPTARLPVMAASGAGHAAGIVPDPPSTSGTAKFLREDATWAVPAGGVGGGSPGGADTYVQFNDAGAFGGVANLAYNKTSGLFAVKMIAAQAANAFECQDNGGVPLVVMGPASSSVAPIRIAATAAGDSNQTPMIQGYDGTTTAGTLSLKVARGGTIGCAGVGGISGGNNVPHFAFVTGSRTNCSYNVWMLSGAGHVYYSPDGTKNVFVGLDNNGTIGIGGNGTTTNGQLGLTAGQWGNNTRVLDVLMPGGTTGRTYLAGYGNVVVNMTNPNSGAGWDATDVLTVNIDPIVAATGKLAKFSVSSAVKMSVGPDGSIFLANVSSAPATPTGGGIMYVESGALKYKGSSGTVTVLGAA